ncbi:cupin domain-containing protein [Dongia soli]|uniref:Cupin domain-containing protein n=1 Tax=Dongia soli TaxID=600628 RepID=A0ABU5ED56_9PROT|nr:cupin domain-containing protein [Dongia soli]MDY0883490.1 cupin domain-containing protein [Dongia soli]
MPANASLPVSASDLVDRLALQPHPEGGFFRETYRASLTLPAAGLAPHFSGARQASTAIYYLLAADDRSRLHRIRSDEVWHFYLGDPLQVIELTENGEVQVTLLGTDFAAGQVPQHVVPGGRWFGACPAPGSAYSLVGCTVAPGFDFADFDMADRPALLATHPAAADWIKRLT